MISTASRVQWATLAIGKWCGVLRRRQRRRRVAKSSPFAGVDRSTAPSLAGSWATQPQPCIIDTVKRAMPIALNPETHAEVERLLDEVATPRTWAHSTPDQLKLVKMGPVFKLDEMSDEELREIIRLIPPPRGNPA